MKLRSVTLGLAALAAGLVAAPAAFAASADVRAMLDTGAEVGNALDAWRLDAETRGRIYARAMAGAHNRGVAATLRSLGLDRRVQAVAGGTVVTLAAAMLMPPTVAAASQNKAPQRRVCQKLPELRLRERHKWPLPGSFR